MFDQRWNMPRWQHHAALHSWAGGLLKFQRAQSGALLDPMLPKQCSRLRRLHEMSETISGGVRRAYPFSDVCVRSAAPLRICFWMKEKTKKISSKKQRFMLPCTTVFRRAKLANPGTRPPQQKAAVWRAVASFGEPSLGLLCRVCQAHSPTKCQLSVHGSSLQLGASSRDASRVPKPATILLWVKERLL